MNTATFNTLNHAYPVVTLNYFKPHFDAAFAPQASNCRGFARQRKLATHFQPRNTLAKNFGGNNRIGMR